MKRIVAIFTLLVSFNLLVAQRMAVQSFKQKDYDITATLDETKRISPYDNKACALIKVITTEDDFIFDGNDYAIVGDVLHKPGEYWLYVPYQAKSISISHYIYGVLKDYSFDMPLESGRTYELYLDPGVGKYITILSAIPHATIDLDGKEIGTAPIEKLYVTYGDHTITARNKDAEGEQRIRLVNDGDKSIQSFSIDMHSTASERVNVTIICEDSLAQINIADRWGIGRLNVQLPKGDHTVTTSKYLCADAKTEFSVTTNEDIKVQAAKPVPLVGYLKFETRPKNVKIIIDGNTYADSDTIELTCGSHETKIEKRAYHTQIIDAYVMESTLNNIKLELAPIWSLKSNDAYLCGSAVFASGRFMGNGIQIGKVVNTYDFNLDFIFGKTLFELDDPKDDNIYERKGYIVSAKAGKLLPFVEPRVGFSFHHFEGGNMPYVSGGLKLYYSPNNRNVINSTFLVSLSADYNFGLAKKPDLIAYRNLGLLIEMSLMLVF